MKAGQFGWGVAFLLGALTATLLLEVPRAFRSNGDPEVVPSHVANSGEPTWPRTAAAPSTPARAADSATAFDRYRELAAQGRGGAFAGVKLVELAEELPPEHLPEYAREIVAMPSEIVESRATNILFSVWARHDLAAAARFALGIPRSLSEQRESALSGVVDAWPEDDAAGLIDLASKIPQAANNSYSIRNILSKAAASDPQAALSAATTLGLSLSNMGLMVNKWAQRDESAAREWVSRQPAGSARESLASVQAMMLIRNNPEAALSWIDLIDSPRRQEAALVQLVSQWATQDREAAAKFVAAQQDPVIRDAANAGYLAGWAGTDPAAAAKFLDENPETPHASALAMVTLQTWIYQDPPAAAGWVASFPDGESKNLATTNLLETWCSEDMKASFAWLDRQIPSGPQRDAIVVEVANRVKYSNPSLALQVAGRLPASKEKTTIQTDAARDWLEKNPGPAIDWIRRSDLPPEVKARLLAPPRSR